MIGFFLGIHAKLKMYAVAVLGFLAILATVYSKGKTAEKNKRLKERLEGMKRKQEVVKDVEAHTDDELLDGITRRK